MHCADLARDADLREPPVNFPKRGAPGLDKRHISHMESNRRKKFARSRHVEQNVA